MKCAKWHCCSTPYLVCYAHLFLRCIYWTKSLWLLLAIYIYRWEGTLECPWDIAIASILPLKCILNYNMYIMVSSHACMQLPSRDSVQANIEALSPVANISTLHPLRNESPLTQRFGFLSCFCPHETVINVLLIDNPTLETYILLTFRLDAPILLVSPHPMHAQWRIHGAHAQAMTTMVWTKAVAWYTV